MHVDRGLVFMLFLVVAFGLSQQLLCQASPAETAVLLVVAHEDFLDELQPLVEWKNRTGIPTISVGWQSLNRSYTGSDAPERIKRGIADFQQRYGIEYVMLVGDCHNFPVRYQINDREERKDLPGAPNTLVAIGAYYACDLYYADLYDQSGNFDSWDYDGDRYYGELWGEHYSGPINHDRIDMIPDVAVGRVPASDEDEVTNYVNKVIHYERTLADALETWISKSLFIITSTDFPAEYNAKLDAITLYSGRVFLHNKPPATFLRMYSEGVRNELGVTTDYEPDAATINQLINTQGLGLINFAGHGWQGNEVNDTVYHCGMAGAYATWDILNSSTQRYPIVFGAGCGNGRFTVEPPYDPYVCDAGVNHIGTDSGQTFSTSAYPPRPDPLQPRIHPFCSSEVDSFGEYGLVRTGFDSHNIAGRGFIAFIGCVTAAQNPIGRLDAYFLGAFFAHPDGAEKRMGDLWKYMVAEYCYEYGYGRGEHSKTASDWFDVAKYHQPMKVPLFGDPSLRVGGLPHQPPQIETVHLPIPSFSEGTTVDLSPYISFSDPEGETLQYRIDSDGDGSWDTRHYASEWVTSPAYRYRDDFDGSLRIQASDGEYYSEVATLPISIYNIPPSPEIETPAVRIHYDSSYRYRFLAGDPGDDTFTYTINFGDDSPEIEETTTDKVIGIYHTYDYSGEYTINVTVADDDGGIGSTSITVQVTPPDPTTEWVRQVTQQLGGGNPLIGFIVFGVLITAPAMFAVTAWVKIPKWWRGCPMTARVMISVLPMLTMISSLILLRIIPLLQFL